MVFAGLSQACGKADILEVAESDINQADARESRVLMWISAAAYRSVDDAKYLIHFANGSFILQENLCIEVRNLQPREACIRCRAGSFKVCIEPQANLLI